MPRNFWTAEEENTLRDAYPQGYHAALSALPHRTERSIFMKARKMNLRTRPHWTEEENQRLRRMWGEDSLSRIAERLGRTRYAVHRHAKDVLGLKVGCPEGWEHITHSAKRTGYSVETLKNILAYSSIGLMRSYSVPSGRARHRHLIVQPSDVDYAVSVWCRTETLFDAACRRGMLAETLKVQLIEGGLTPPATKSQVWRLPSEDIDAAIKKSEEQRSKIELLKTAATRLGMSSQTLKIKLTKLGVPYGRWGVKIEDIDRIKSILTSEIQNRRETTLRNARFKEARAIAFQALRKAKAERLLARKERRIAREALWAEKRKLREEKRQARIARQEAAKLLRAEKEAEKLERLRAREAKRLERQRIQEERRATRKVRDSKQPYQMTG